MTRPALLAYQWVTGLSDTATGTLLYLAPVLTLRLLGLRVDGDPGPWISYIGAFVLAIGLSCLYGAYLVVQRAPAERLEVVWLLTAFTRSAVAIYLFKAVLIADLEPSWLSVAAFDGACVVVQAIGLRRDWIAHAT